VASPTFFDFDAVGEYGEGATEAGSQAPVVEVAEVAFKRRIDEPLVVFFGERAKMIVTRCRGLWSGRPGRGCGVHVGRVGR
jgi:hypothetical protein